MLLYSTAYNRWMGAHSVHHQDGQGPQDTIFASIHSISWLPHARCEPCPSDAPTPLAARCLLNRSMFYQQSFASRFTITGSLGSSQRGGQNYVFNRTQFQARTSLRTSLDCNSRRGKD